MANILTVFLILAVVIRVIDFAALTWIDYVIFMLIGANVALTVIQIMKGRGKHGGKEK